MSYNPAERQKDRKHGTLLKAERTVLLWFPFLLRRHDRVIERCSIGVKLQLAFSLENVDAFSKARDAPLHKKSWL